MSLGFRILSREKGGELISSCSLFWRSQKMGCEDWCFNLTQYFWMGFSPLLFNLSERHRWNLFQISRKIWPFRNFSSIFLKNVRYPCILFRNPSNRKNFSTISTFKSKPIFNKSCTWIPTFKIMDLASQSHYTTTDKSWFITYPLVLLFRNRRS